MLDRLIELLTDSLNEWECDVSPETVSEIAEHLLENGLIVPPCKVGDTVFSFDNFYKRITEFQITGIEIVVSCKSSRGSRHAFSSSSFGKTLFHTRESAEQALKGGVKK